MPGDRTGNLSQVVFMDPNDVDGSAPDAEPDLTAADPAADHVVRLLQIEDQLAEMVKSAGRVGFSSESSSAGSQPSPPPPRARSWRRSAR
jgi:hypothetical protein